MGILFLFNDLAALNSSTKSHEESGTPIPAITLNMDNPLKRFLFQLKKIIYYQLTYEF